MSKDSLRLIQVSGSISLFLRQRSDAAGLRLFDLTSEVEEWHSEFVPKLWNGPNY